MLRSVKSPQRLIRQLHFKVTGTGTAAINQGSYHGSLTDNGTGDYTITFTKPFKRAPIPSVVTGTAGTYAEVSTVSTTVVRVLTKAPATGTATDAIFFLTVTGFDSSDET